MTARPRWRRALWLPLLALSLALLALGLAAGQWGTVLGYASQICASCIGLTF